MKILLFTVTAGEGHNSIAKALKQRLESNHEVVIIDYFKEYSSKLKYHIINEGYIKACKFFPNLFNLFFKCFAKTNPNNRDYSSVQNTIKKETPKVYESIHKYNPDVIICTHFYPAISITNLRKIYNINIPVLSILTDWTVHPYWECAIGVDYIITPHNFLHDELIYKGYQPSQLKNLGLPVKNEFSISTNQLECRKELNISPKLLTCMVMMGGGGFGNIIKTCKKLFKAKTPTQFLVVCGNDTKSKKKIEKLAQKHKHHKINIFGFINNVNTMMASSDLLIGKCGCISANEALNMNVPLFVASPHKLPVQEQKNLFFLEKNNCATKLPKKCYLTLDNLSKNKSILKNMIKNIELLKTPNATSNLCTFIENLTINKTPLSRPLKCKQTIKLIKKKRKKH